MRVHKLSKKGLRIKSQRVIRVLYAGKKLGIENMATCEIAEVLTSLGKDVSMHSAGVTLGKMRPDAKSRRGYVRLRRVPTGEVFVRDGVEHAQTRTFWGLTDLGQREAMRIEMEMAG